ncbi:MAG: sigma-70 family RNA polymerase sigma factor [Spirochaetes bacterium]|nr:sigma-70 family RNA polymerase sigma factor [Spirochaetota bacterium]
MTHEKLIAEIYELYSKELYIYINRYTRSSEASEDILQDTFHNLIIYSKKHTIDKDRVRAFLYRTAHNLCINYRKKESRISFTEPKGSEQISGSSSVSDQIESGELEVKIYELLEEMDPLTKSIFIMKKENNMSIDEIAENTGKSTRTVRRRMQKALSYLHDALKQCGFLLLFLLIKMAQIAGLIVS